MSRLEGTAWIAGFVLFAVFLGLAIWFRDEWIPPPRPPAICFGESGETRIVRAVHGTENPGAYEGGRVLGPGELLFLDAGPGRAVAVEVRDLDPGELRRLLPYRIDCREVESRRWR